MPVLVIGCASSIAGQACSSAKPDWRPDMISSSPSTGTRHQFAEAQAEWLDHECADWVVQNCRWEDNFQRLLAMSGPGTVRGCTCPHWQQHQPQHRHGSSRRNPRRHHDRGQHLHRCEPSPAWRRHRCPGYNTRWARTASRQSTTSRIITSSTFIRSGGPAMKLIGIQDSRIENNPD